MGPNEIDVVIRVIGFMVPFLLALSVHEAAHAWAAEKLGDDTGLRMNRLTLNPMSHIDPLGSLVFPIIALLMPGGFIFGWAKPVPVNPLNLKNPRKDMLWIALAGPASNLVLALIVSVVYKMVMIVSPETAVSFPPLILLLTTLLQINILLMCFNLVPIPPLDGSKILAGLLPSRHLHVMEFLERYQAIIFIAMLLTGMFRFIVGVPMMLLLNILL